MQEALSVAAESELTPLIEAEADSDEGGSAYQH